MLNARVTDIRYRCGFQGVTIFISTPLGPQRVHTSQDTLTARAGGGNWGDAEAREVAQVALDALAPDTFTVVE